MSYDIKGTDTSDYEGPLNIDAAVKAGSRFILPRVTYGDRGEVVTDNQFVPTWTKAKGKLRRGGFHFLDIGTSIRLQAETFAAHLAADPGEIEPYVDFEQVTQVSLRPNPVTGKRGFNHLSIAELTGFMTYFHEQFPVWPWKRDIGVYTGLSYWKQYGTTDPAFLVHPLWISQPDPVLQPDSLWPWGVGWNFWQQSWAWDGPTYGTDPLNAKGIDGDVYNDGYMGKFEDMYPMSGAPVVAIPAPTVPTADAVVGLTVTYASGTKKEVPL